MSRQSPLAPSYPHAPKPEAPTRQRLWFLYCIAHFRTRELTVLTGLDPQILTKLRREWMLWQDDPLDKDRSDFAVLREIVGALGLSLPVPDLRSPQLIRRRLRAAFRAGGVAWSAIDRLPDPARTRAPLASPGSPPPTVTDRSSSPPLVPITRHRLWLLYCVARCIKAEIEYITGWTRGTIDYGLRRWQLHMLSPSFLIDSDDDFLLSHVAKELGVPTPSKATTDEVRKALHQHLARHRSASMMWLTIDQLPTSLSPQRERF